MIKDIVIIEIIIYLVLSEIHDRNEKVLCMMTNKLKHNI